MRQMVTSQLVARRYAYQIFCNQQFLAIKMNAAEVDQIMEIGG
jgi:hypothetical protein